MITTEKNYLHISIHPLVQHKLSHLRDISTSPSDFRKLVDELSTLLIYEATTNLSTKQVAITTPLETIETPVLKNESDIVIVPIMRAGVSMINSLLMVLPNAKVGFIGLYRDESSLEPQKYYLKLPPNKMNNSHFICDPMLATGGSIIETINQIKANGAEDIRVICILASPEGVAKVHKQHPDVPIYCAAVDRKLNENGYIVPGLGDAGDRLYGTL